MDYHGLEYYFMSNQLFTHYLHRFISHNEDIKDFRKKDLEFPVLRIQSTLQNPSYYFGYGNCEDFLVQKNLIEVEFLKEGLERTKESVELVEREIIRPLQLFFQHPKLSFSTFFFYSKRDSSSKIFDYDLRLMFMAIFSVFFRNFKASVKTYRENREQINNFDILSVHKAAEEFVNRFQGAKFHGGEKPDRADVKLFAYIQSMQHNKHFSELSEGFPEKFQAWVRAC